MSRARRRTWALYELDRALSYRLWFDPAESRWEATPFPTIESVEKIPDRLPDWVTAGAQDLQGACAAEDWDRPHPPGAAGGPS